MAHREERYAFIAEWHDPTASITRKFQIFYYNSDASIEMYDMKNRRPFLKRMPFEKIKLKDFYIGSTVMILSRKLEIVAYGDEITKLNLAKTSEKTIAIITSNGFKSMGKIIDDVYNVLNLHLTQAQMIQLDETNAKVFHSAIGNISQGLLGLEKFSRGRVIVLELMGESCVRKWRDYLGLPLAEDITDCQVVPPAIGSDNLASLCYGSESVMKAEEDQRFFFENKFKNTAGYKNCTCCIIKPHILQKGLIGRILESIIDAGYTVTAMQMFHMELANAEEFYEVYKGVVGEYKDMVHQLISGPCIAMEIFSTCTNTCKAFRETVGPIDPEIARQLRPMTIRARFGTDRVQNAVHCTDLPDDAVLEIEYFFKILST